MSDYRFKIGDSAPMRAGWPKISGRRGRPHQPFFFSVNQAKLSFIWYKNLDRSFFRFVTIHACDGRKNSHRYTASALHGNYALRIAHCAVKMGKIANPTNDNRT